MKKILIKLINLYQITPLHSHTYCRYIPTCSEYAKQAINEFGTFKGIHLSIKRILRCNPFFKGGIDNIPWKEKE